MKSFSILGRRRPHSWMAVIIGLSSLTCSLLWAAPAAAQDAVVGNAEQGRKKMDMCIGCHGIVGYQASFPEVHHVPKLSGQAATYIAKDLHEYKSGERKHPTMHSVASSLSDQDIADLAAAYEASGQPAPTLPASLPPADAKVTALIQKGACTSCHGPNLSQPIDPTYPRLAGQYADYLARALHEYKQGERKNPIMGGFAGTLSEADINDLAAYFSSLPGSKLTDLHGKIEGD